MAANYREGAYVSPWGWGKKRKHSVDSVRLGSDQKLRGTLDWDSLENVQGHIKDLKTIRAISGSQERYFSENPDTDTGLGKRFGNPFHAQGLGPKNYKGQFNSDRAAVQSQFWEATERKFLLREEELKGVAAAGGPEQYAAQQTAREALSRPFAEGTRAAELLRQDRGPRTGGGAAQGGAGRQASRARAAEGRRLASNDRTTGSGGGGGGSTASRRLRAANLLRQPLGAGSQSAAQLLG
jgi:hypothetical protein